MKSATFLIETGATNDTGAPPPAERTIETTSTVTGSTLTGSTVTAAAHDDVVDAAVAFSARVSDVNRRLLKARGLAVAPIQASQEIAAAFAALMAAMARAEEAGPVAPDTIRQVRDIVGRWLFRSRIWNRAYHKPHGYAGDFMTIEWMYDLETDPCVSPIRPAIVNALDHMLKSVAAVVAVWERRRWLERLVRYEYERRGGCLRVLDVAAGGARYLRDVLAQVAHDAANLRVTIVDQDPAAIAFLRSRLRANAHGGGAGDGVVRLVNAQIRDVGAVIDGEEFDVVISAGLFDYLDRTSGRALLGELARRLTPDGALAITNFHSGDPSRLAESWICDWQLAYRDETECAALFPPELEVSTSLSSNGAIIFAVGRL